MGILLVIVHALSGTRHNNPTGTFLFFIMVHYEKYDDNWCSELYFLVLFFIIWKKTSKSVSIFTNYKSIDAIFIFN